jgi:hypothetical protein
MNPRPGVVLICAAAMALSLATGFAQGQRIVGTVAVSAPVMLLPETGRTPLATLAEGTQIQVLSADEPGWYRISFQDSYLWGDRVGYVRAEYVRVSAVPPSSGASRSPAPGASTGGSARSGLSEASVATAIAVGRQQKGAQGLRLLDTGQRWTALPAAGARASSGNSRFRLQIHTPLAWIQQLASDAARESSPFALENVTDEMTRPVLRVTAFSEVTAGATGGGWRIQHVVLRGERKAAIVQPLTKEVYSEHILKAMGGSTVFEGLRLTFPLDAVRRLRGDRGDGELVITVIDARGGATNVRIAKQHFVDLPM